MTIWLRPLDTDLSDKALIDYVFEVRKKTGLLVHVGPSCYRDNIRFRVVRFDDIEKKLMLFLIEAPCTFERVDDEIVQEYRTDFVRHQDFTPVYLDAK